MQLILTILATLLAGVLVVLVPGAGLLAWTRIDRVVPPPLVPGAALALGLVPLVTITAATLALRQPIEFAAASLALFVLLTWSSLAARARVAARGSRTHLRARGWLGAPRDLVAGEWLRGTPTLALVLAALGGVLALVVGFYAWNDSLYHIGQAQKLLALDAPSFTNTIQFRDGSAHPGYLIPVWQEAIALTAFVARVDPVVVSWVLPGLTLPVSLLAFGGLGWAATRARGATVPATAAPLLVTVGTLPLADTIVNGLHPGAIALGVLAPLVLAMVFTAAWSTPREEGDVIPRTAARAATFLAMVATAGIGVLHVSYLWVLGMGVLGYALVWVLRAPWRRDVVRRHLMVGGSVALVAAACIALLLPGLMQLEGLGRDAQAELEANDSPQYEGENAANLDALLRGDPEDAFHLRADYLVQAGGLALLGLLVIPFVVLAPRWPGGWYLSGAAALVLAIALSDTLFPAFVRLVTLDQARRIERVLPLSLALGLGALAIGVGATALWRRGALPWRVAAASLAIGAATWIAIVVDAVPPLAGYGGGRIVHPRVIAGVFVAVAMGLVGGLLVRRVRRRLLASWEWPTALVTPPAVLVGLAVLLVGAAPAYDRLGAVADEARLEKLPIDMRTAEMRLFAPNVARELRRLPVGATVLADPRERTPYIAMAIAPVYVVSSVPRHTALTPKNRVDERFETAAAFFRDDLTAAERRQLLIDERVDAVIVHPFGAATAQAQLARMPGVRVGITGKLQRIYLVDRTQLTRE